MTKPAATVLVAVAVVPGLPSTSFQLKVPSVTLAVPGTTGVLERVFWNVCKTPSVVAMVSETSVLLVPTEPNWKA